MKTFTLAVLLVFVSSNSSFSQFKPLYIQTEFSQVNYYSKNASGDNVTYLSPGYRKHIGLGFAVERLSKEFSMSLGYAKHFNKNEPLPGLHSIKGDYYISSYSNLKEHFSLSFNFHYIFSKYSLRPYAGAGINTGILKFDYIYYSRGANDTLYYNQPNKDYTRLNFAPQLSIGIQPHIDMEKSLELSIGGFVRYAFHNDIIFESSVLPAISTLEYGLSIGIKKAIRSK